MTRWLWGPVLGGILLVLAIVVGYLVLPRGPGCPACGWATVALRGWLPRLSRGRVVARWCLHCGWQGMTRRPRSAHGRRTSGHAPSKTPGTERDAPGTR